MGLTVLVWSLALLLLPLGLCACGDGGEPGQTSLTDARQFGSELSGTEANAAAGPLLTYLSARARREWTHACSYLGKAVRRHIGHLAVGSYAPGTVCPSYVAFVAQELYPLESPALERITIDSVRVDGDRGFVLYEIFDNGDRAMPIRLEGGYWKLGAVNGFPIRAS